MSGVGHAVAPVPLIAAAASGGAALAAAGERFERAFLASHPGYRDVRPALLPLLIPGTLARSIRRTTATVIAELRDVPRRFFGGDANAWSAALGYDGEERAWLSSMADPSSLALASMFARVDFVLGAEGPVLVEVNVGPTIGGIGVLDRYSDLLSSECADLHPGLADGTVSLPRPGAIWARFLRRLCRSDGAGDRRVALVLADDEAMVPHPHEAAWCLRRQGAEVDIVRADEVRFQGNRAVTPSGQVGLVFGCFTFDQLRQPAYRRFVDRAMACARDGGPVYVAPPTFTLFGNKAMLTYLDARAGSPSSSMLPRTYRLDPQLRSFALENRRGQVLKPAIGYGGDGVTIGTDCSPSAWGAAIERALGGPEAYVLQEYVPAAEIAMPTPEGLAPYQFSIGCLQFGDTFAGLLLRQVPASSGGATNCKQGASFAAAAIVDDRMFAEAIGDCSGSDRLAADMARPQ